MVDWIVYNYMSLFTSTLLGWNVKGFISLVKRLALNILIFVNCCGRKSSSFISEFGWGFLAIGFFPEVWKLADTFKLSPLDS